MTGWIVAGLAVGALSFSLAHNYTTGKALAKGLGAAWKEKVAEWKAQP